MVEIRPSTLCDCEAVYALICEMEGKALPIDAFREIYSKQLVDENYTCLVGVDAGMVLGCINLRMECQLHHAGRICEIMELAVAGNCRSNGLGTHLFQAACEYAKRKGCLQIEVCCNRLRTRAHGFYQARGMHNFHYKFSLSFDPQDDAENRLGR